MNAQHILDNRRRPFAWLTLVCTLAVALLAGGTTKAHAADTTVTTATELGAVVDRLNANGGAEAVRLGADLQKLFSVTEGTLTVLGEGYTLTGNTTVTNDATLNLGSEGYAKTLVVRPNDYGNAIINLMDEGTLNLYNGVTIGYALDSGNSLSQPAGGVMQYHTSTFNMYGGTITDCKNHMGAGAVFLDVDSHFYMYGGTITKCTGAVGGAVGLSSGSQIGHYLEGGTLFQMEGGTISDCTAQGYGAVGGGAVFANTSSPVTFIMNGGTISGCSGTNGGAVYFASNDSKSKMELLGGTITGCKASKYGGAALTNKVKTVLDGTAITNCNAVQYGGGMLVQSGNVELKSGSITVCSAVYGGGLIVFGGNTAVANGFGLHNNTASAAGDDIFNNGTTVTLGTVDTTATLESCGDAITG